jgi:hypothetical protein
MHNNSNKGWSVRVLAPHAGDPRYPVTWYIVAESDRDAAVAAVRRAIDVPISAAVEIEAVQQLPVVFQGRRLQPGEVAYLYRRGAPRG